MRRLEGRASACPRRAAVKATLSRLPLVLLERQFRFFSRSGGRQGWRLFNKAAWQSATSYAAAAFGPGIFFFDFGFFSSNSKPTFPFSNFK